MAVLRRNIITFADIYILTSKTLIMNNQQPPLPPQAPPQLPPQAPQQLPPQMPQQQPQYQQPYQQYPFNQQPKKGMSTLVKVLIGIGAFFAFCVIVSLFWGNDKTAVSAKQNEATQKWKDKAIEDSTQIANGYYAASAMSDFETFINRYHQLELMSLQHHPKEVTDSAVIRMGNKNTNDAMGILIDSATVYRNTYTKIIKDKLWLDNIKVRAENDGKNLWLIGGMFANNRNIAEFHEGMKPMFKALGYKRIYYKWADISYAEYTYFDLDK